MILTLFGVFFILAVSSFTGIDPLVVDIDGLGQEVDGGLKVLHAYVALYPSSASSLFHFHFARLFVVAKRTVEQYIEWLNGGSFRTGLSLRLSSTHLEQKS
jgi:hypothetical protein